MLEIIFIITFIENYQEQAFPLSEKFCLILSSSQYIVDMLSHWSEIPVFLQLQHERYKEAELSDPNSLSQERKGLFQDISGGFDFLVRIHFFNYHFDHTV